VVNTDKSGLTKKAVQYEDKMGHLEEDSKENKDLLYGNGRKAISQRYRPFHFRVFRLCVHNLFRL